MPLAPITSRPFADVLVIGAGPSGCAAAISLAAVARVRLIDRARFPRDKVCGCCLNGAALHALHQLGIDGGEGVGLHTMKLCHEGRELSLPLRHSKVLSRSRLDALLVERARSAGVEVSDATTAMVRDDESVELRRADQDAEVVTPRAIIVASGLGGGEKPQGAETMLIGAGTTLIPSDRHGTPPSGVLDMIATHRGYVGTVMLEDGRLDIAAAIPSSRIREHGGIAGAVVALLGPSHPLREALAEASWRGTPLLRQHSTLPKDHRTFLIGDAFAYAEPFTGEGIAWALESGIGVAGFVKRALVDDGAAAGEWHRYWSSTLQRKTRACRALGRVLESPRITRGVLAAGRSFAPLLSQVARLVGR